MASSQELQWEIDELEDENKKLVEDKELLNNTIIGLTNTTPFFNNYSSKIKEMCGHLEKGITIGNEPLPVCKKMQEYVTDFNNKATESEELKKMCSTEILNIESLISDNNSKIQDLIIERNHALEMERRRALAYKNKNKNNKEEE